MDSEYILYLPESLSELDLIQHITNRHLKFQFYSSSKHHPNAIFFHRTHVSKKIVSSTYTSNEKTMLIYYPELTTLSELKSTSDYLIRYQSANIKILLIIEGADDRLETSNFNENQKINREELEELTLNWLLQGVDTILTSSTRETVNYIEKFLEILTENPYKPDASIFRTQGKKLKQNTEIPKPQQNWALQLINIQGVSESKAQKILQKFPSMKDLIEYYQSPAVAQSDKENALNSISDRKERKISERIFKVYSSTDPNQAV